MKKCLHLLLIVGFLYGTAQASEISSAYFSYSLRTPKTDVKALDYEIAGGMTGEKYLNVLSAKYERENGEYYRGLTLITQKSNIKSKYDVLNLLDAVSASINIDESVNLSEQLLIKDLTDLYGLFQLRLTNKWTQWRYVTPLLGAKIDFSTVPMYIPGLSGTESYITYDTNFNTLHTWNLVYKIKWDFGKFYISPNLEYRLSEDVKYIQFKNEVGISF